MGDGITVFVFKGVGRFWTKGGQRSCHNCVGDEQALVPVAKNGPKKKPPQNHPRPENNGKVERQKSFSEKIRERGSKLNVGLQCKGGTGLNDCSAEKVGVGVTNLHKTHGQEKGRRWAPRVWNCTAKKGPSRQKNTPPTSKRTRMPKRENLA